ncbi:MAG: hypothetical protein LUD72_00660 [Bacteroidales bacterium]|nr:hypothetical protein [Bacteroidales bacterium]
MGLFSKIRENRNNRRYNNAVAFFNDGEDGKAIEILKSLQGVHPLATDTLLEIYHSKIKNGKENYINCAVDIYRSDKSLRDKCVDFCEKLGETNATMAMGYSNALYKEGIEEVSDLFVKNARTYILANKDNPPQQLDTITNSPELIGKLVPVLYGDVRTEYEKGELDTADRLSDYLVKYTSDESDLELHFNIHWEKFSGQDITSKTIGGLDTLLTDIRGKLSDSYVSDFEDKVCQLSKSLFDNGGYSPALLLSSRVWDKIDDARKIYIESAYRIYKNPKEDKSIIDAPTLDKMLGKEPSRISGLERFVGFDPAFEKAYIDCISKESPKQQLEFINHTLTLVETEALLNAKARACEGYIKSKPSGDDFIIEQCNELIGKHPDAQIFLVRMDLSKASDKNLDVDAKEAAIREAVGFGASHSKSFSAQKYKDELSNICKTANQIAKQLWAEKDADRAVALLYYLKANKLDWYETYVELYSSDEFDSDKDALSKLRAVAEEGRETGSRSLKKLWEKILSLVKTSHKADADESKLAVYGEIIDSLSAYKDFVGKGSVIAELVETVDDLHFKVGKKCEKSKKYKNAIQEYGLVSDSSKRKDSADCRILLCEIKEGKLLSQTKIKQIGGWLDSNVSDNIRKDLAFRLCLYLAQNGDIDLAQSINDQYLNDPEITSYCSDQMVQRQERKLEELNKQMELLSQAKMSGADALSLTHDLSEKLRDVAGITTLTERMMNNLKTAIEWYAIEQLYNEGGYIQCYNRLNAKDPSHNSNPADLRNIAVMCLCAAENGQMDDSTYKEFIALWVTAVYQPDIFIQLINHTIWDDPYKFSMYNALGVLSDRSKMPENVSDTNGYGDNIVFIRDIQNALMARMENVLEQNPKYLQFYNEQIKAIDLLSQQRLHKPCVIVAPHLLELSPSYKKEMTKSLEEEEKMHAKGQWENILKTGVLYGITTGNFGKYKTANTYLESAFTALQKGSNYSVAFDSGHINAISEFNELYSSLVAAAISALNKSVSDGDDYKKIGNKFYKVCEELKDDNFSFVFSNHICQKVIAEANSDRIPLGECANVLFDVYKIYKDNPQLNRNLKNIVKGLVFRYITEKDSTFLKTLDKIFSSTRDFDQSVVDFFAGDAKNPAEVIVMDLILPHEESYITLSEKLSSKSADLKSQFDKTSAKLRELKIDFELIDIVTKVDKKEMKEHTALQRVYNLYASNKDNVHVCQGLASLIPTCVMEYIAYDKVGKQGVIKVLNSLQNNMSRTFRNNNSVIKKDYHSIWNSLPYNTQIALRSGYNLTDKGYALKSALDWLKKLS